MGIENLKKLDFSTVYFEYNVFGQPAETENGWGWPSAENKIQREDDQFLKTTYPHEAGIPFFETTPD